jgi:murein DD-endopeptidase MepM/ murein hydrolase activator NlpD
MYYSFLKGEGKERRDELGNFASYRKQPHRGSDWGFKNGSEGKPVYAVAAGVVSDVFWTDALGHCVTVKNDHDQVFVLVAHLQEKSTCKKGDKVTNDTVLGKIGNTGSASVGAHLHAAASKSPKPHLASFPALLDLFKLMDADKAKRDGDKPKVEKPATPKAKAPAKKKSVK